LFLVICNSTQKNSIISFFIQKFLDKLFSCSNTCLSLDIFKSCFNCSKFLHFSCHFISKQPLYKSLAKIHFIPLLFTIIFFRKGVLCNFYHFALSPKIKIISSCFLMYHILNTPQMILPFSLLFFNVFHHFIIDFFGIIFFLLHGCPLFENDLFLFCNEFKRMLHHILSLIEYYFVWFEALHHIAHYFFLHLGLLTSKLYIFHFLLQMFHLFISFSFFMLVFCIFGLKFFFFDFQLVDKCFLLLSLFVDVIIFFSNSHKRILC